jgi:hypothetical protein
VPSELLPCQRRPYRLTKSLTPFGEGLGPVNGSAASLSAPARTPQALRMDDRRAKGWPPGALPEGLESGPAGSCRVSLRSPCFIFIPPQGHVRNRLLHTLYAPRRHASAAPDPYAGVGRQQSVYELPRTPLSSRWVKAPHPRDPGGDNRQGALGGDCSGRGGFSSQCGYHPSDQPLFDVFVLPT